MVVPFFCASNALGTSNESTTHSISHVPQVYPTLVTRLSPGCRILTYMYPVPGVEALSINKGVHEYSVPGAAEAAVLAATVAAALPIVVDAQA